MALWNKQDWRILKIKGYGDCVAEEVLRIKDKYECSMGEAIEMVKIGVSILDGDFKDEQVIGIATEILASPLLNIDLEHK